MNQMTAAARWIATWGDEKIQTYSALTFIGHIAWSYAEPIGILLPDGKLYVTGAKFSVTTSKHTGQIIRAAALAGVVTEVKDHGVMRSMVRQENQGALLGSWGRHYESAVAA